MNEKIYYCETCGAELKKITRKIEGFNHLTGEPNGTYLEFVCPKAKWWQWYHIAIHTIYF